MQFNLFYYDIIGLGPQIKKAPGFPNAFSAELDIVLLFNKLTTIYLSF